MKKMNFFCLPTPSGRPRQALRGWGIALAALLMMSLPAPASASTSNFSLGSYTEIRTNWNQLGLSNCGNACAKSYAASTRYVADYSATENTHWYGKSSNSTSGWQITQVGSYYQIKNTSLNKCMAMGDGSESPSSAGYVVSATCNSGDNHQLWQIYDTTSGSSTGGVEIKSNPSLSGIYANACWMQDVWSPGIIYARQGDCGTWKAVYYFGGTYTAPAPDHYEIVTPASNPDAGASTTITIKACTDASCSSLYTTSTPSGIGVSATTGTLGSLSAWSGGSATISLTKPSAGSSTLSLTGTASPAATNSAQCYNGSTRNATTSCVVTFNGPDHYEIVTPASSPAAGASSTITIKACADSTCSSLYTTSTPSGIGVSTTAGTLGSLSAWSSGSATISLSSSAPASATLSLTGTAIPAATNTVQCYNGSTRNATTSCAVSFIGPDHYEIVTPASNPAAGASTTITVKACADASCSSLYTTSTPSGIGVSATTGTLGSLSAWSGGSATISLTKPAAGSSTLSLTGTASPASSNTMQCYNGSTRNTSTSCVVTFDGPDHYEIVTPATTPDAGASSTITIKACADASCSSLYTTSTPSGIGVSATTGSLGSLSAWSGGSATISLTKPTAGSSTLSLTGTASPAATNAVQCYNGSTRNTSTSCVVTFVGPDHYEIVTPASNPNAGDSTTITIKACANAACSSLYTSSTPSGIGVATTAGTLGSLSAWSGGSATISLTSTNAASATLSLTGTASPAATNTAQCYNGTTRNATTSCVVTIVGPDHIEIAHDGTAVGGVAETITIKSCTNSGTGACVQFGGSQAITLTSSAGTFASTGTNSVTIAAFTGSTTQSLTIPIGGSATLSVSSPTPTTAAAYTCNNGSSIAANPSANCTLGALTDHYQISTANSTAVAADGSTSKTVTIRSCSNALSSACTVLSSDTSTVSLSNLGVGTLSSSSVTLVAGEATLTITSTTAGTAQLKVTAPAANNGYTCTQAGSSGAQTAGSDTEAKCQVSFSAPALHHFQISQASTATVAADGSTTKAVTVKACGDLGTTCNALATGTASATLSTSLAGTSADVSIIPLTLTSGQGTFNLKSTAAGTTTLATSSGSYRCSTDGGTTTVAGGTVAECQMTFTVAALHHYQISTANSTSVAADGSDTKTVTIKACADTGTSCNALATGTASVTITSSLAGTSPSVSIAPLALTSGQASFTLSSTSAGTTTLATGSGSYRCSNDGGSTTVAGGAVAECQIVFAGGTIHHYLISQADTAMISDDGITSKTITIKGCLDAGATCNSLAAGTSTITVTSSLSGTATSPSTAPLTLTNGHATFSLNSTQSGITTLAIASPPAGGYYCSVDGGTTLVAGGSVSACQVMILVSGNGFQGTGIYSSIKTNWRRLGWSNCDWNPLACAQSFAPSKFWLTKGSVQTTHVVGNTTNPGKLWVVENAAYAGAYTIRDYAVGQCLALGNGTESPVSLGYLVYKTCDSADKAQQWLIYPSTAGSAVDGVELKTIPTVGYGSSSLCWSDPVWTTPETEIYVRDAGPSCGDWKDVFYFGGTAPAATLYVKISHSPTALVCGNGSTVTVQACSDAACTTGYPSAQTLTLSASGSATWLTSDTVNVPANSTAGVTLTLKDTKQEDVVISLSSPSGAQEYCSNGAGGSDCKISFLLEGLSISASNFYAHKGTTATVTALKSDGSVCTPLVDGAKSVTFWARYAAPTTGTKAVAVNGSSIDTVSAAAAAPTGTSVTLNFSNGVATVPLNYDDAGSVTLNASITQTPTSLSASSSFTTAPAGFCITPTTTTGCASGDPTSPLCLKYVAAGDAFGMTVNAMAWESDADTDYCTGNGGTPNFATDTSLLPHEPTVSLATTLVQPAGGTSAALQDATSQTDLSAFEISGGQWSNANVSIPEVGIFTVKASSSQGGLSIPQVAGASQGAENLGRFYPKRLGVSTNAPTLLNGDTNGWSCAVTYVDQTMRFSSAPQVRVTGLNAGGQVTKNYRLGNFWKLGDTLPVQYLNDPAFSTPGSTLSPATGTSASGVDDGDGRTFSLSDSLKYAHDGVVAADDAPFDAHIALTLTAATLKDSDNACYLNSSPTCATGGDAFTQALSGAHIVLGQVVAKNVLGSSGSSLNLPVDVLAWTGSTWSPNDLDNGCTSFGRQASNYQGELQASDITISAPEAVPGGLTGQWQVPISAPTDRHAGSVDITITGLPAYLKRSPGGGDPAATATFSRSATLSNGQGARLMFRGEVTGPH